MVNSAKSIYEVIIYEFPHQQDRGWLMTLLFITTLKTFDKWETSVKECFSSLPQINKGYEFESETDTEVIPKLIKYIYDNRESDNVSFSTLVERVIQQLVSRWHGALLQTMTATVPEKHANPVYSQEECATKINDVFFYLLSRGFCLYSSSLSGNPVIILPLKWQA